MDARPDPSLEEQIEAVKSARDYLSRSAQWRAGRKGFDPRRHDRDVRCLEAALATLVNLREAAEQQP